MERDVVEQEDFGNCVLFGMVMEGTVLGEVGQNLSACFSSHDQGLWSRRVACSTDKIPEDERCILTRNCINIV